MNVLTAIGSHWPVVLIVAGISATVIGAIVAAARGDGLTVLRQLFAYAPLAIVTVGGVVTLLAPGREGPEKDRWTKVGGAITLVGAALAAMNQVKFERETLAEITGGDSYVLLAPLELVEPGADGGHRVGARFFGLSTEGDHPVYDVRIDVENVTQQGELIRRALEESGGTQLDLRAFGIGDAEGLVRQIWQPGNLPERTLMLNFAPLELPDTGDVQQFRWTASARNGRTFGEINYRRVGAEWRHAWRAVRNHKVIHEHVQPDYPRDAQGEVRWQGYGITSVPGQAADRSGPSRTVFFR